MHKWILTFAILGFIGPAIPQLIPQDEPTGQNSKNLIQFLEMVHEIARDQSVEAAVKQLDEADLVNIAKAQLNSGSAHYLGDAGIDISFPGLPLEISSKFSENDYTIVGPSDFIDEDDPMTDVRYAESDFATRINLVMIHLDKRIDEKLKSKIPLKNIRFHVDMTKQQWDSLSLVSKLKIQDLVVSKFTR